MTVHYAINSKYYQPDGKNGLATPMWTRRCNSNQKWEKPFRMENSSFPKKKFSVKGFTIGISIAALAAFIMIALVFPRAFDSLRSQVRWADTTARIPAAPETPRKHCRQIATKEACFQNVKCRWVTRKYTCEQDYIATVQPGDRTIDETVRKFPEVLSGKSTARSDVRKWALGYSNFSDQYKKTLDLSRFQIYQKNVEKVIQHNNQYLAGATTWWKGINFFTDMTEEELKAYTGYIGETHGKINMSTMVPPSRSSSQFPPSVDYREQGVVTPVKDQGRCGSGFAFAAVAAMESKYAMLSNEIVDLSEQHVLDCSHSSGNSGCNGGNFKDTFNFLQYMGVDTEANIPYEAVGDRSCRDPRKKYDNPIFNWKSIDQNEEAMKEAIFKHGPIVASLSVDSEFFSYKGGVFTASNNTMPNHAVLVVGYGYDNGTDVWYIKNSWGKDWGNEGFMSIQRNLRGLGYKSYAIINVQSTASGSEKVMLSYFYALGLIFSMVAIPALPL